MAGRRGRGRGRAAMSFNVEQLGFSKGEALPGPVLAPPPLYPPLANRLLSLLRATNYDDVAKRDGPLYLPVPLQDTPESEYLLTLKKDFVDYLHDSPAYLQHTVTKKDIERYSDRYQTLAKGQGQLKLDWSRFPKELRPHVKTKTTSRKRKLQGAKSGGKPAKIAKKNVDITSTLAELEKKETLVGSDVEEETEETEGKEEGEEDKEEEEEGEDVEQEDLDEEMDDGTDYVNNYFDNGENYLDEEDDNLDDGPVY
uniref:DNA-directed RNA polymerase III subunit n=1 Tax=Timema douglasi TaxID=61478 RepID=A0A7R8VSY0_TIMDO|nr:unnamed protein product [Timema douglasi]